MQSAGKCNGESVSDGDRAGDRSNREFRCRSSSIEEQFNIHYPTRRITGMDCMGKEGRLCDEEGGD